MELHTITDLFPSMSDDDFATLKDDIKRNGCINPLWVYGGKIIDGRHRFKACMELNIEPDYKELDGTEEDVVLRVISNNLHRRHLSESQRAMVAANIANMPVGNNKKKKTTRSISQPVAARMLNVSKRSVSSAKKITENGTKELNDKVNNGEIPVSVGAKIAKLPTEEQNETIKTAGRKVNGNQKVVAAVKKTAKQSSGVYVLNVISKENGGDLKGNVYKSKADLMQVITDTVAANDWDSIQVQKK